MHTSQPANWLADSVRTLTGLYEMYMTRIRCLSPKMKTNDIIVQAAKTISDRAGLLFVRHTHGLPPAGKMNECRRVWVSKDIASVDSEGKTI